MKLERNDQFDRALELMQGDAPFVFVTGKAGTGKSTLLRYFIENTTGTIPVLAPTGVAALNVRGETIHRFFKFAPGVTREAARKRGIDAREERLYQMISTIVIDEISMVRADLLDCIDIFLRTARRDGHAFGGVRVIAIGDLYQLPPVVTSFEREAFATLYTTPYFFSSHVITELLEHQNVTFVELEKVYRQTDDTFIRILNGIRNRSITEKDLAIINTQVTEKPDAKNTIILTTTNTAADAINETRLALLKGKEQIFDATVSGQFPEREAPTDFCLRLKKGARVMCVVNDQEGKFVNGSLGKVHEIKDDYIEVILDDGDIVDISPYTWTVYRSTYDKRKEEISQERMGGFTQFPLRLAWAITIHKSQGKTFDRVAVDMGTGAFAAGQTYVALSRCRSLEGLSLKKPVTLRDIRLDFAIVHFLTSVQYAIAEREMSLENKIELLKTAAEARQKISIIYLKGVDEKTHREIIPKSIAWDMYAGKKFLALRAHCLLRQQDRTFNVARILKIKDIASEDEEVF